MQVTVKQRQQRKDKKQTNLEINRFKQENQFVVTGQALPSLPGVLGFLGVFGGVLKGVMVRVFKGILYRVFKGILKGFLYRVFQHKRVLYRVFQL
jgi:hypothetical protein